MAARSATLAAGALIGFSLLMFLVWQLYGQFTLARQQMEFSRLVAVEDKDLEAALAMFKVSNRSTMVRLARIWRPALTLVAVPGVLGGIVIVVASIRHLIWQR